MSHFKLHSAVYLIIEKDNKILFLKRANTNYCDGMYSLPAGHLDGSETATNAAIRELKEEAGVIATKENLSHVVTIHRITPAMEYIDLFFKVTNWQGEIKNMEPNKCSELEFYSLNEVTDNVISEIKQAIEAYQNGISYIETGWDNPANKGFANKN